MHTHLIHGHSPIVLSVPHDGATLLLGMPSRSMSKPRDLGTLPLAQTPRIALHRLGLDASMIWLDLHRSLVDTNDEIHRRAYVSGLESEFDAYHDLLDQTIEDVLARNDRCFLLDIHRCDFPGGPDLILGSDEHRTSLRSFDKTLADHLRATCSVAFSPDHALGIDRRYRGVGSFVVPPNSSAHRGSMPYSLSSTNRYGVRIGSIKSHATSHSP